MIRSNHSRAKNTENKGGTELKSSDRPFPSCVWVCVCVRHSEREDLPRHWNDGLVLSYMIAFSKVSGKKKTSGQPTKPNTPLPSSQPSCAEPSPEAPGACLGGDEPRAWGGGRFFILCFFFLRRLCFLERTWEMGGSPPCKGPAGSSKVLCLSHMLFSGASIFAHLLQVKLFLSLPCCKHIWCDS